MFALYRLVGVFFSFLKSVEYEVKCVLYRFKIFYSYEVEYFERIKFEFNDFLKHSSRFEKKLVEPNHCVGEH